MKNKFSDTLNLPKTNFPMRANLANREGEFVDYWKNSNIYHSLRKNNSEKPSFVLHDGPPYANGQIHIGHSVNKILKDTIIKSKLLSSYDVNYIPGWDCHGLPIEIQIEKLHGKVNNELTNAQFKQLCRDFAEEQINQQRDDFLRLGILGQFDNPYKTKDFDVEANEVLALKKLYQNGFIRQGVKPVYWSTGCVTALAEAEIEYHEKTSKAIDVFYPCLDKKSLFKQLNLDNLSMQEADIGIVIWTTTPWTIPASQAIAINEEIAYCLAKINLFSNNYFVFIATELLDVCAKRYGANMQKIKDIDINILKNIKFKHPLYNREIPIVIGDHVTIEAGTGCVHTAPAHGPEDFVVGEKYGLDSFCPIDENGYFYQEIELVGGLFHEKSENLIIEKLKESKYLFAYSKFNHSYPHCWRTKTPLIFRSTKQWFVSMENVLEKAINSLNDVNFFPSWGKERMQAMLNNRPDWCISRQRYWGVPITFITHKKTGEMHPDILSIIDKVAEKVRQQGTDAWYQLSLEELIGEDAKDYEKCLDILDVWFDSGLTHQTLSRQKEGLNFPADLYLEGSDQHRGWFQSSLLTAIALNGKPPFKSLLTHGFTVDQNGKKMSKSIGNIIEPQKICKTLGADILRLWIASSDYRNEMSVSDEIFKRISESYRRIRNTIRYFLGNLYDFDPQKNLIDFSNQLSIDRWAISQTYHLQNEILEAYKNYEFHSIAKKIQYFCTIDMGSFYLDILKDRLYTCQNDSLARRSGQTALWHICNSMVRWLAPILSFTSEEIWQELNVISKNEKYSSSVFSKTWYEELKALPNTDSLNHDYWEFIKLMKTNVDKELESLRNENLIGGSLDAMVEIYADNTIIEKLNLVGDELRFALITSYAKIKNYDEKPQSVTIIEKEKLALQIEPCPYEKCARSWHRREDVGKNKKYPDLDSRSIENVYGKGEVRLHI